MKLHAFLRVKGLELLGEPDGARSVMVKVQGVQQSQRLYFEAGRYYIELNGIDPFVPKDLRSHVTGVISREVMHSTGQQFKMLKPGKYASRTFHSSAEVTEEFVNGHIVYIIEMSSSSLASWKLFRPRLLAGQIRRVFSYVKTR